MEMSIDMTKRRKSRSYTDKFKQRLIRLYHSGKRKCDICREYDIAASLISKRLKQSETIVFLKVDSQQNY